MVPLLLRFAEGLQVDAELLAFFVEVAAFEAEGAGDIGHVEVVAAEFGEQDFFFEGFSALQKSSLPCFGCSAGGNCFAARKNQLHIFGSHGVLS